MIRSGPAWKVYGRQGLKHLALRLRRAAAVWGRAGGEQSTPCMPVPYPNYIKPSTPTCAPTRKPTHPNKGKTTHAHTLSPHLDASLGHLPQHLVGHPPLAQQLRLGQPRRAQLPLLRQPCGGGAVWGGVGVGGGGGPREGCTLCRCASGGRHAQELLYKAPGPPYTTATRPTTRKKERKKESAQETKSSMASQAGVEHTREGVCVDVRTHGWEQVGQKKAESSNNNKS